MEAEKLRNTTEVELLHQQRELNDQLFRLRFQLKMGQTESLKKLRGMRKDIARIQTILRQRQLGIQAPVAPPAAAASATPAAAPPAAEKKAAAATGAARQSRQSKKAVHKPARKTEKKK